jgi:hypothetical protein
VTGVGFTPLSADSSFAIHFLTPASRTGRQVRVVSETEVLYWLAEGVKNRAVGFTQLNAELSRSHLLLTLTVERAGVDGAAARLGKLLLVDLAGSEKVKKTGAATLTTIPCLLSRCAFSSPDNLHFLTFSRPPAALPRCFRRHWRRAGRGEVDQQIAFSAG